MAAAKAGRSQVLVLRGEPGIGKTALLDVIVERAAGCRIGRACGVESEMELAYAGLHQLCGPFLDGLDTLPAPQRDALGSAFGLRTGSAPDRFLVGLAVLTLLSQVAEERPLVCVVDDTQWLDQASVRTLAFVARRLTAEPMAVVFAISESDDEPSLAGLPELLVHGLGNRDAAALLESGTQGTLDPRVRDRIVAESHGNPLALLELPRALSTAELAFGGATDKEATPAGHRLEQGFLRQLAPLPRQSRRLLLAAAAEPVGDVSLLWRAAERLGIGTDAATAAEPSGLIELRDRVRFRHPLVRSALYRSATPAERREIHGALADVTDPDVDPDRRAWHRAHANAGQDEDVAVELERSAGRAQARGGAAAAAAFLEYSVMLTADPLRRAGRALAAAEASTRAGAFSTALGLLNVARAGPLGELASARADVMRGRISFAAGPGSAAASLLLEAAERLRPLDPDLARETYLDAWTAASFAGRPAGGASVYEVSRAARSLPPARRSRPVDLLLDGLALLGTGNRAAAAPALRKAVDRLAAGDVSNDQELRWGWIGAGVLWDDDAGRAILTRQVQLGRESGALDRLPIDLIALAQSAAWRGDLAAAASLVAEINAVCEITGSRVVPYAAMLLAALRGDPADVTPLVDAARAEAEAGGQGAAVTYAYWVTAILHNGLGRYDDALTAARRAVEHDHLYVSMWALPELVEAAARSGHHKVAARALAALSETTGAAGTDFGLGIEARSRALLSDRAGAEGCYEEAIGRLGDARLRTELARAHLLYGEWLRRENRRGDARVQLRIAHGMLDTIGMTAFAERARRELLATGETVRPRTVAGVGRLTSQETLIVGLVVDGLTNAEIGGELFLSARTVEWHLRNVFIKLGITSRRELRREPAPTPG